MTDKFAQVLASNSVTTPGVVQKLDIDASNYSNAVFYFSVTKDAIADTFSLGVWAEDPFVDGKYVYVDGVTVPNGDNSGTEYSFQAALPDTRYHLEWTVNGSTGNVTLDELSWVATT